MMRSPHSARGIFILTLTTFIWGTTFVVVKLTIHDVPPAALVFARFLIAAAIFTPFLRLGRKLWLAAIELGILLCIGFATQTIGLRYASVDRSAFITSLHVIFVPAFAGLLGRGTRIVIWIAAGVALLGVGLLSHDGSPPNIGDLWTAGCAISWGLYIARLETFAAMLPSKPLTAAHLWVVAVLGALWTWQSHEGITKIPWPAILYLGIAATAVTTWFQTLGQRWVSAPQAAVLYTMEPVWAAAFGWFVLLERLGTRGWVGAVLIVLAALLTQAPIPRRGRRYSDDPDSAARKNPGRWSTSEPGVTGYDK
jgi:drug/metabolite transporter (DMT)-like permease